MAITDKVKKMIRPRAFLFKLIVTILVFVCIPLLAAQIFVVNESTEEFNKNNQDHYLTLLQGSAQTFASREDLLFDTAWRMSRNEDIRKPLRHSAAELPLKDKEAADAISGYSAEILHMKSVGVFYISKGYLLTNGCKYTLREYCSQIEAADEAQVLQMEEFFLNLKYFTYYASSDGSTLIAALPISLGVAGRKDAVAFFAMDANSLEESYRANISGQSSIAVLDEQGKFLLKGEDFTEEKISSNALSQFLESNRSIDLGNSDLLLYRYTDSESGFTFLLTADRDGAQKQLLDFANRVRIVVWIVFLVVMLSLLVTIYINYKPLHNLLKKYANSENREVQSEIEQLDSALFRLDKEMSTQKDLLTEFILGDLLFGKAVKPELLNQYFPAGSYHSCVVFTAQCAALTMVQSKRLTEKMEETTGCTAYVTSVPNRPHAIITCLSKESIDEQALCSAVAEAVAQVCGVSCPVGMGEVVTDIHDLRASYRSAVVVNLEPSYAEPGANANELNKKIQAFSQSVHMGEEAEILTQLEEIREFLYTHTVGEGHQRYYGFKLINAYLTNVDSGKVQLSGKEVELLLSYTNLDHLFKLLSESVHQICGQMTECDHTIDAQMQQRLIQYVDDNFTRSELCLTTTAEHVGISIYAVSRLFKEVTGKGFKDYVTEKRLEYGHTLLCSTNASIAEVAASAGFDNANYFSTIFKLKYGMPPTKYRNEQKEKQVAE